MKLVSVCILLWLCSIAYFIRFVPSTPFFVDECGWVRMSMVSAELFLRGDFTRESWELKGPYGELNLPLGKLLMGVPLLIHAQSHGIAPYKQRYNRKISYDENRRLGLIPPRELLWPARTLHAGFGATVCVAVFLIAFWLRGWIAAFMASGLILSNPVFVTTATQAMMDMPYNLFLLLALAALILFSERGTWTGRLCAAALCGIAGGLASCIKFTGLPLTGLYLFLLLLLACLIGKLSIRASFGYLAVTAICGMGMVYLLTPNYWPRFQNFNAIELGTELRGLLVEGKKVPMGDGYEKSPIEILTSVYFERKELRAAFPQFCNSILPEAEFFFLPMRWRDLYAYLRKSQGGVSFTRLDILYGNLIKVRSHSAEAFLLLGSLAYCCCLTWNAFKKHVIMKESIVLSCFMAYAIFLLLTMDFDSNRYYLPSIILSAMLCGIGASALMQRIKLQIFSCIHKVYADKADNPPPHGHTQ